MTRRHLLKVLLGLGGAFGVGRLSVASRTENLATATTGTNATILTTVWHHESDNKWAWRFETYPGKLAAIVDHNKPEEVQAALKLLETLKANGKKIELSIERYA